jgi:hypothetical protein
MNEFLELLRRAGLSPTEAKTVFAKFSEFGFSLTKDYPGDNGVQSDNQRHHLVELLRKHTPLKRVKEPHEVVRELSRLGYFIRLPAKYPVL